MQRLLPILALLIATGCPAKPGSSTPTGGSGDCKAQTEMRACQDAAGCRWLTPGCAADEETALPESATGCYPVTDPCDGTDCADGTECQEVVVNPCLPNEDGVACDACGEAIKLCLPGS